MVPGLVKENVTRHMQFISQGITVIFPTVTIEKDTEKKIEDVALPDEADGFRYYDLVQSSTQRRNPKTGLRENVRSNPFITNVSKYYYPNAKIMTLQDHLNGWRVRNTPVLSSGESSSLVIISRNGASIPYSEKTDVVYCNLSDKPVAAVQEQNI